MMSALCTWDPAYLLFVSDNVYAPLVYYSHISAFIVSLLIGLLVFLSNPRALANRVLFALATFFAMWAFFDLVIWATEKPSYVMFFWASIVPIELSIYASGLYLVSIFANRGKDISLAQKLIIAAFFVPIFLLAHTSYNLLGFDYSNCDRNAIEGPLIQYMYIVELLFIGWAAIIASRAYHRFTDRIERRQLLLVSLGTILMLLLFTSGNLIVTYFLDVDWSYDQYKLFGMPLFVAFVAYSIVKLKTFNVKLIAAQALVAALATSVLSLLFVRKIEDIRIIAGITFVFVCILGFILARSVKREIEQRERIEALALELRETNERQEGLLHFIGHEVKGYLTKASGAFSSLVEGDFGKLPEELVPFVERSLAQSRDGALSVENILTASNQKNGRVSYTKAAFNLKEVAEAIVSKAGSTAREKGLAISFSADEAGAPYTFNGDKGKIGDNVFRNLIDNSVNYTPSGSINVSLKKENNKFIFAVKDTGIGINDEDKKRLFTEGGHGKDSQKVNVHSTGYGLYIAKNIVEAHGGTIRAESDGASKGSTFIVEFPA